MRWQPIAVSAGLLAPPVLLAAAVWPEGGVSFGGGPDGEVEAELALGDSEVGATNGFSSTDYLIVGPGRLRIDVDGPEFDPTLTLVDDESGEQIAYNDDFGGCCNPSLAIELGEGESLRAQVRSLGGPPGGRFEISVSEADDATGATDDGDEPAGPTGRPAPDPTAPPPLLPGQEQTETTIAP